MGAPKLPKITFKDLEEIVNRVWSFNKDHKKSLYSVEISIGKKCFDLYLFEGTQAIHKAKWPNAANRRFNYIADEFFTMTETITKSKGYGIERNNKTTLPVLV